MLRAVEAPWLDRQTDVNLFKHAHKHAGIVTSTINKQDQMTLTESDYACQVKRSSGYIQLWRSKH